jgi:hypothetical protein
MQKLDKIAFDDGLIKERSTEKMQETKEVTKSAQPTPIAEY